MEKTCGGDCCDPRTCPYTFREDCPDYQEERVRE